MSEERCIMYIRKGVCEGYDDIEDVCGPQCPYRKTRSQQKEIEETILKRFRRGEGTPLRDFKSNLTDNVLYPAYGDFEGFCKKQARKHKNEVPEVL